MNGILLKGAQVTFFDKNGFVVYYSSPYVNTYYMLIVSKSKTDSIKLGT